MIARDAYHLRVFLKNPGKETVRLQMPAVIAARPVDLAAAQDPAKQNLAQQNFFNPGANNGGNSFGTGSQGGGKNQAVSGPPPFGITNNASNNQQGQNNVFAIPPESTREFRVATVCVEHGKPNPRSMVKYELVRPEVWALGLTAAREMGVRGFVPLQLAAEQVAGIGKGGTACGHDGDDVGDYGPRNR